MGCMLQWLSDSEADHFNPSLPASFPDYFEDRDHVSRSMKRGGSERGESVMYSRQTAISTCSEGRL
jgi:hypothetical protein